MMRRVVVTVFLIGIMGLAVAGPAKADNTSCDTQPFSGCDTFTYKFDGNTYQWHLLPGPSPDFVDGGNGEFEIDNVTFTVDGMPQTDGTLDFISNPLPLTSGFTNPGGFVLSGMGGSMEILNEFGAQIFGGTLMSPTFSPTPIVGIPLTDFDTGGTGNLVITSASAVPEPGGLVLIGTGLLALFGIARKKLST